MPRNCIRHTGNPGRGVGGKTFKFTLFALAFGLLPAAAPAQVVPPTVEASYAWTDTSYSADGTYQVSFDLSFHNPGWTNLENLTIELLDAEAFEVVPHQNRLSVGRLNAGQTVALSWTVTALFAPPRTSPYRAALFMSGQAEDTAGNVMNVTIENREEGK